MSYHIPKYRLHTQSATYENQEYLIYTNIGFYF